MLMNTTVNQPSSDVREHILATGQRLMAGKGFSAVGLNEILTGAGVPKGSFYHYFGSKDAFGEALLEAYFADYLAGIDATLAEPGKTMAQRLLHYFQIWQQTQSFSDCQGKCLAVKMAAEVADLSEAMRLSIKRGTEGIVSRLAGAITAGVAEGSLQLERDEDDADSIATSLYQLWLGASVMVKIERRVAPFETAMKATRKILHLSVV